MTTPIQIDSTRLLNELQILATFSSAEPAADGTAVTRIVFSPDDLRARAWLKELAAAEDFEIREDAVGNLFLRWLGTEPDLPAVATGSHIDAIPHAGMYDGTVGVLGGLEAIRALKNSGLRPRRSIELVMFTAEEPTRFGLGCLGSRLLSGTLDAARADALHEANESAETARTLADIRTAAGFTGPLYTVHLQPNHYHAWLELHIEQGPHLEHEGIPIGIVTGIAAPASYRFTITGYGGHAGTLLMPERRDALAAAAEIILSVEKNALGSGSIDTVATIGTCAVHPGAVNSVPSRVVLQLDIRDTDPARRERVMQNIRRDYVDMAQRREVTISEELINADSPAPCSPHIVELLKQICTGQNLACKELVSRAYHDSLFMAPIAPIGMIFIPCRNGVSHRPDEYAAPTDILLGTQVLAQALAKLASE
ncbi:MAG: M20 family metallo-hydrolase [Edaphobacter sp.]